MTSFLRTTIGFEEQQQPIFLYESDSVRTSTTHGQVRDGSGRIVPARVHISAQLMHHPDMFLEEHGLNLAQSLSGTQYLEVGYLKDVMEGNKEEALRYYKKAQKKGKPEAATNAGVCLLESGKQRTAARLFQKAWDTYGCKYSRLMLLFLELEKCRERNTKGILRRLEELRHLASDEDAALRTQAEIIAYYWHARHSNLLLQHELEGYGWKREMTAKLQAGATGGFSSWDNEAADLEKNIDSLLCWKEYSDKDLQALELVRDSSEKAVQQLQDRSAKKKRRKQRKKRVWKNVKTGARYTGVALYYVAIAALFVLAALGEADS